MPKEENMVERKRLLVSEECDHSERLSQFNPDKTKMQAIGETPERFRGLSKLISTKRASEGSGLRNAEI